MRRYDIQTVLLKTNKINNMCKTLNDNKIGFKQLAITNFKYKQNYAEVILNIDKVTKYLLLKHFQSKPFFPVNFCKS